MLSPSHAYIQKCLTDNVSRKESEREIIFSQRNFSPVSILFHSVKKQ